MPHTQPPTYTTKQLLTAYQQTKTQHPDLPTLNQHITQHAKCRNHPPDTWYPEPGQPNYTHKTLTAIRICNTCPVQNPCLIHALRQHDIEHGIIAATTPQQRQQLHTKLTKQTGPLN